MRSITPRLAENSAKSYIMTRSATKICGRRLCGKSGSILSEKPMAETSPAPNNKSVTFGTKMEREMAWNNYGIVNDGDTGKNPKGVKNTAPMKPESQADGAKDPAGVTNTAPMKKKAGARKKARNAMKRGLVSEKAAKKHLGGY
jgi:hypothetical protein